MITSIRLTLATAMLCFLSGVGTASAAAPGIDVSQQPLFTTAGQAPLMMMVMSRDEQLFIKAYDDYSDLDGDGILDTSYLDRFDYSGYFDPAFCYSYASGQFAVTAAATGSLAAGQKFPHQCSGSSYSGNFMNWVSMSRLDVLRFVLDGGKRVAPEPANGAVLERAPLPADLHAWAKVYAGSDTNKYTPYSGTVSFCNATMGSTGTAPSIRAAQGPFPEWAATALQMCNWREESAGGSASCSAANGDSSCFDDPPQSAALATTSGLVARVQVCANANASLRESFCQKYTDSSSGTVAYRPVGLLQTYGESGKMRFGLLSGSFAKPRSGGVLRRNIGLFAANTGTRDLEGCAADDEVNLNSGKFCTHSVTGNKGIVSTLGALDISGYYGFSAHDWNDCNTYGILNRQGFDGDRYLNDPGTGPNKQNCAAWGNPLSEMYAEALRYISTPNPSASTPSSAFTGGTDLAGLPTNVAWKDPYRSISTGGNAYCANCSILVLSTGLNSFDSDEIPTVAALPRQAGVSTQAVGTDEGVSGNYSVGRIATGTPGDLAVGNSIATHTDLCTAKGVADLGLVRGICPDIPAMEGSYLMDGLAFDAWTTDLRPDLISSPPAGNPIKPSNYKNVVKTFAVALARNLPSFNIPVGSSSISLAPLCQANNSSSGDALGPPVSTSTNDKNWRSCYLGSVTIGAKQASASLTPSYAYGRSLDTSASPRFGAFSFVWEDSLWGNDHENDVVTMVTYCVGSACNDNQQGGRKNLDGTSFSGKDICWRAYGTTGTTASTAGGFTAPGLASATKDPYGNVSPCPANGRPAVASDEVLIRIENLSAYAGNAMLTGYNIAGSTSDGIKRLTLRPGNVNNTLLNKSANPDTTWYAPIVLKYKSGPAAAKQLPNPLFYAAKYGSFDDLNHNGKPETGEWDKEIPGTPDNFFAVTDPSKLKTELQKVFDQVLTDAAPTASVATSTPRFVNGVTLAYEASFNATDWTGDLKAYKIRSDGVYSGSTPVWLASEQLPAPTSRKIFTSTPQTAAFTGLGIDFTKAALPVAMQTKLMTGLDTTLYNIDDVVAYLRGNQSKEQDQTPPGPYRTRSSQLGDVLNSSPAVSAVTSYGYGQLLLDVAPTAAAAYSAFIDAKKTVYGPNSENPVVFYGSNDGMLHAIDGSESTNGGKELFAYVPNAAVDKMGELVKPSYVHRYFADGSPTISDAYLGAWKTVLLASTGGGSRSVFALDVTNPSTFAASKVMWEFNSNSADADAHLLGQDIGRPWLGLADDGNWVAAFGNGYNNDANSAVLFIRKAGDGTKVATIAIAPPASCTATPTGDGCGPNGLATAVLVDNDNSGAGDTIYAGDYLGNMWRFEYNGTGWVLGNGGSPVFVARDVNGKRQSITSGVYTVANPLGGTMVIFGSGRYLGTNDADPMQVGLGTRAAVDTVYGVLDSRACTTADATTKKCTAWSTSGIISGRSALQPQSITSYTPMANDGSGGVMTATRNAVNYRTDSSDTDPTHKMGWYLDMSFKASPAAGAPDLMSGQRVIVRPDGILTDVVVNTIRPQGNTCVPGVQNATMVLDALTGAADYIPVAPEGGWPTGTEPPLGMVGTDTYSGPPQGEPPILIIRPPNPIVPCLPSDPTCVTITPPVDAPTSCSWRSPNSTTHPPGKPMPCGRISWRQLR